jgi:cytochrome P450
MPEKADLTQLPADPSKLPLPPGTMGLPIIGQSLQLLKDNRGFFLSRFQKYGPVFKTSFALQKVVCFVGHGALTFFYNPDLFAREGANPNPIKALFNNDAVPLVDGEVHRVRKALYLSIMTTGAVAEFLPQMQNTCERFLQSWERKRNFVWQTENEFLGLGLSNLLMLGEETGSASAEQKDVIDTYVLGMASLPINLPFTRYGRALRSRDTMLKWVADAMVTHRRRMQPGQQPIHDILTSLLRANDNAGRPLTDDVLKTDGMHVYFSIYTGWAVQLTWVCLSLGLDRRVMERARAEVAEKSPSGVVTMEQLDAMPYVRRVTQEVRRLNPVLPVTFQAKVRKTCAYNGYRIPAGWTAIASVYATMQDPAIFVAPDTFEPDRFAPGAPMAIPPNGYVPHGGGDPLWHKCLGQDVSSLFLELMTVLLLRCYDWDIPEQDLSCKPGSLFSVPKSGLQVVFRRA